jgi:hypothetical protein
LNPVLPLAGGRGYCEGKVEWGAVPDIEMADVFVEMADTLVAESGRIDFLHGLTERCVQVLRVSTAGILFTDGQGLVQVVDAASERARLHPPRAMSGLLPHRADGVRGRSAVLPEIDNL